MRAAIIVNIRKIDKKSLYGRITAIGDAFMKPSTMNKAEKSISMYIGGGCLGKPGGSCGSIFGVFWAQVLRRQ